MSYIVGERKKGKRKSMSRLESVRLINSILTKFEIFKSIFLY